MGTGRIHHMKKIVFVLLFICFFALQWKTDLLAEEAPLVLPTVLPSASSFQIASLFYKLSNAEPDFRKWAMETDAFKEAAEFDKATILHREESKLRQDFSNFNFKDAVVIYFDVSLENYSLSQENFFFPEITRDTYLPYFYAGEEYVVLLKGIEKFGAVPVPKQVADRIQEESGKVEFTIIPEKAENAAPIQIDGVNRWVIVGQIAEFRLWNQNRTTLYFSERAPWYNPRNKIMELFKE